MGRRVVFDEECRVGCASCAELCSDVFEMDEETEKAPLVPPPLLSAGDVKIYILEANG